MNEQRRFERNCTWLLHVAALCATCAIVMITLDVSARVAGAS